MNTNDKLWRQASLFTMHGLVDPRLLDDTSIERQQAKDASYILDKTNTIGTFRNAVHLFFTKILKTRERWDYGNHSNI
jgi:hypothetical protein